MKRENCKDQEEEKKRTVFDLEVAVREQNAATEKCQQPKPRTTQAQTSQLASVCVCVNVCVMGVCVLGVFLACLLTLEIEQPKMCKQVCWVQVRCCLRQLPDTSFFLPPPALALALLQPIQFI